MRYIDAATSTSDMPGMNMMGAAMQGASREAVCLGRWAWRKVRRHRMIAVMFWQHACHGIRYGPVLTSQFTLQQIPGLNSATQGLPPAMLLGESLALTAPEPEKSKPAVLKEVDETLMNHYHMRNRRGRCLCIGVVVKR